MRFCIVFLLLLLITTALFACSPSNRFSAGKPVSREELSEIAAGIFGTEATTVAETATKSESETNSKNVETEAEVATETTPEHVTAAETASKPTNTDTDTDTVTETEASEATTQTVYWTKSGKVYHTDPDCRYIRNSANVLSGTVEESGKDKICSSCEKSQEP